MISPFRPIDLDDDFLRSLDPTLPRHNGVYINMDSWDSYLWERDLLLGHIAEAGVENVSFLTGDIHMFWQSTLAADYDEVGSPKVANEFVGGGVSSPGINAVGSDDLSRAIEDLATQWSPAYRYCDFRRNGYGLVEATPGAMNVSYRATRVKELGAPVVTSVRFGLTPGVVEPTITKINP